MLIQSAQARQILKFHELYIREFRGGQKTTLLGEWLILLRTSSVLTILTILENWTNQYYPNEPIIFRCSKFNRILIVVWNFGTPDIVMTTRRKH